MTNQHTSLSVGRSGEGQGASTSIPRAGDRLYAVPRDKRIGSPEWLTVAKVGRKWLTLRRAGANRDWGRCDKVTLAVDAGGHSVRHTLYRTKEEHDSQVELSQAWGHLRTLIGSVYAPPKHLTASAIREAIAILGPVRQDAPDHEPAQATNNTISEETGR